MHAELTTGGGSAHRMTSSSPSFRLRRILKDAHKGRLSACLYGVANVNSRTLSSPAVAFLMSLNVMNVSGITQVDTYFFSWDGLQPCRCA
jgi:hypothetical protein